MGFPVGYSDLLFPRLLLHIILLLGYIRHLISRAFETFGLGDLIQQSWRPELDLAGGSVNVDTELRLKTVVQDVLEVVQYKDIVKRGGMVAGECAVCLYEFGVEDEVRRLSNCCHVFHRCCLDRWMEHDQRTCPLCRAALFPGEMVQDEFFSLH